MTRKNEIRIKRQTGLSLSGTTVIAGIFLAILTLNPNTAFAKVGDACKTDADCVVASGAPAEVCDVTTSKCVLKPAPVVPPPASPAKKFTCADIVFSSGSDGYGCTVAAALDWSMPRTVTIETKIKIGKMTKKQLDKYNAALENLVRQECWRTFDYLVGGQLFGVKDPTDKTGKTYKVAPMTVAEIRAFMQEDAQRLDVMAIGRHPRGPKGDQGDTGPQGDPGECKTCPDPGKSGPVK